ncbi:MAG: BamA/TamA family outer membrane protein, partial [Bacteroidota bacterium]
LFPFRETGFKNLRNVPLPGLGSLALFYNRVIGVSIQDVAHPDNTALRRSFLDLFSDYEDLIYASGHDHNLQYHTQTGREGLQHLLVSGGGSEGRYARGGGSALFTASQRGLMELVYVEDGSVWLEVYTVDGGAGRPVFRQMLSGVDDDRRPAPSPNMAPRPAYADSTVVAAANPDARGGALRRAVTGSGWRDAWTTPVELPVFDLATMEGGLEIVRRGGGLQSRSLRLQKPGTDRQYVLRVVDKTPASDLPAALRHGLDPAERMTTAIHPYASPVAAALADSLGVYHTNPRYFFLPDDPLLGPYREDFGGSIVLFEERPDEDWSDAPNFGGSDNLIGTNRLYREIEEDNDHRVDQEAFLRARLLDVFLGDWDRHRDQWRWASFEPYELDSTLTGDAREQGKVYRPIPRDRDWALNDRDGIVFRLARRYVDRLAGLQESYGPIPSLTANGQLLDQRFLNALDREQWMRVARETQATLSEAAIDAAVRQLPPEVYALHGPELVRRMTARRDGLTRMAERFYETRAARVDVAGSREHERFEVTRRLGETEVVMYKTRRDGEIVRELYRRVFDHDETDELRLYGFDGDDTFVVSGPHDGGPVVRLIGGGGSDLFDTEAAGGGRRTVVYDVRGTNEGREADWRLGPRARFESSEPHPELSRVVQEQVDDTTEPLVFASRSANDGLLLGGGVRLTRFGFLDAPYASRQRLQVLASAETGAVLADYGAHVPNLAGSWGLAIDATFRSPQANRNFFGFGNGVGLTRDPNRSFYRNGVTRAEVMVGGQRDLLGESALTVGPFVRYTNVDEDPTGFVVTPLAGVDPDALRGQTHAGLSSTLRVDSKDSQAVPKRGFDIEMGAEVSFGVDKAATTFGEFRGDFQSYLTPYATPWLTLVPRFGGQRVVGDAPFWAASTLGAGPLRGFRPDRFAGRSSAHVSVEARARLQRFAGYGEWGVFGFTDTGRVWADQNPSSQWHIGYGGGAWISALDRIVFTGQLAASAEDRIFTFGVGWTH